jgi:heme exporter protein D
MSWGSAGEFFAMGGYAFYVWGSFGVCALCLIAEPLAVRARRRAALQRVRVTRRRAQGATA